MSDDRLISFNAAIDALHTWFRDGFDEDKWWNSTHVLAAIEGLPSAQQWIPCKTALPEHDGEYLVTKKSFGWNCTEYRETDIARYEKKDGWHKADTVLAWCELPKPWEGGEK